MAIALKQSTASQEVPLGPFVDATDGVTAETGLTISNTDIKIWKTGATTLADKNSGGATHISGGIYYAVLDATDTDTLGPLVIFVQESGALPVRLECVVLAANVYDSGVAASDVLQVDVAQWLGTAPATPTVAGVPEVDVTHVAGSTSDVSTIPASVAAILVDTGTTLDGRLPAALVSGRIDASVGAMAANVMTAAAAAADLTTELQSGLATAAALTTIDDFLDTEIAAILAAVTGAIEDSVPADGSRPTPRQALYMITQFLYERAVSGTTVTVNKVDGTTALLTLTLDDGTTPTAITRAT